MTRNSILKRTPSLCRAKRYYFDERDGSQLIRDQEGLELDGIEAAKREALLALPDIARFAPQPEPPSRPEAIRRLMMAALQYRIAVDGSR